MGVLEQLRQEADQKKSSEQQEVELVQQHEQLYKTQILPKMQEVLKYLLELIEHLNYLEVPIQVAKYSAKYPELGVLAQKDYKINTDGYVGFAAIENWCKLISLFIVKLQVSFDMRYILKLLLSKKLLFYTISV